MTQAESTAPTSSNDTAHPGDRGATLPASSAIQYVGPDTYILLDSQGRPQAVPGMTYEDFMAAWKQLQNVGEPNRQPRFTIENIEVIGTVRGRHAELHFNAVVHLLTDEAVEVPLGLMGAILDGRATFDRKGSEDVESGERSGPPRGEPYLDYDDERGGFVARLAGHANERHTVSLDLLAPLAREGTGTTLTFAAPRAVSSRLVLEVDSPINDVSVVGGALTGEDPIPDGTRITVEGMTGPLRVSWRPTDPTAQRYASVLSSEGAIRVSVDGRSVRTDARLTVQSFGGSFDRFRVRLPAGAQLVQGARGPEADENPDYRISVEESPRGDMNASPENSQVVLVEFPTMQQGPVTVELSTEQPIGLGDDLVAELSGFDVLGAVRQYGDVALQVAGDWQARWDLGRYVRQVDPSEIDPQLPQADLTAAFQYDRQPWSLRARIAPRQFRVLVTPTYEMECTSEEARLAAHFTYQVLGARAFEFRVKLAGWELTADPVESAGLVDRDQMAVTDDGILLLPLTQGSSRRAEITFSVRRAIPRTGQRVRLPLPVPIADSIGTGELVVAPASDINLLPDLANSIGLVAMPFVVPADSAVNETAAAQRFRVTLPEAVFAADRVTRTREVSNESTAQISFEPFDVRVEQRIDYVVRYEPIKELMFEVPQELALDEENLGIYMAPQAGREQTGEDLLELPVSLASTMGSVAAADSIAMRRMRAVLPNPRVGEFSLEIRYRFPRPKVGASNGAWRLPLVRPVDGLAGAQRAVVMSPVGFTLLLDAKSDDRSWKTAAPAVVRHSDPSHEFVADGSETFLPLAINKTDVDTPAATTIERAWLQSWFSGEMRQDRAAYRLRTTGSQVTVELPPEVPPEEIEVLLDGQAAEVASREAGRIVARLPRTASQPPVRSAQPALHTLELRYRQANRNSLVSRLNLTPPQVVGATALSGVYWQIVLLGDRHVVCAPQQMTSASQWQWLGSFWGRRPILSQADLEQWVGASAQLPATGLHNEYLFTSLAPLSSIGLLVAPRWLVVLAASACVLLLVLAWIYIPIMRRVPIVIAVGILLAGLAIAFPIPALLLAQASVLGIVLAGLSLLVARIVARPARWPVVLPVGSSLRQPAPRAEAIVMPPVAASASTSPTISLRVSESE